MKLKRLLNFGMTRTEAQIYLEIAKTNETQIGPIIKKTGLHRGTVYNSITNLIKKGFISFVDKGRERYYKISGKHIFEDILDTRKRKIKDYQLYINEFFQDLKNLKEVDSEQDIQVFYGVQAFKTLFLDIYYLCKEKDIEYLFQGEGGEMQDTTGEPFYKYTQELKKQMKIKCRIILNKESKKLKYHKYVISNIKYLPSKIKSPVNFWIYDDFILLVLFGSKPLISIRIKSKSLSDSFRNYFEHLWNIAK